MNLSFHEEVVGRVSLQGDSDGASGTRHHGGQHAGSHTVPRAGSSQSASNRPGPTTW